MLYTCVCVCLCVRERVCVVCVYTSFTFEHPYNMVDCECLRSEVHHLVTLNDKGGDIVGH